MVCVFLFKWFYKPANISIAAFARLHVFKYLRSLESQIVKYVIQVEQVKQMV